MDDECDLETTVDLAAWRMKLDRPDVRVLRENCTELANKSRVELARDSDCPIVQQGNVCNGFEW
jgi:hypothetical protein